MKMIGTATFALLLKYVPYIVGIRVIGGLVDIGVHAAKVKIGKTKG
jgi:hypothetical protein